MRTDFASSAAGRAADQEHTASGVRRRADALFASRTVVVEAAGERDFGRWAAGPAEAAPGDLAVPGGRGEGFAVPSVRGGSFTVPGGGREPGRRAPGAWEPGPPRSSSSGPRSGPPGAFAARCSWREAVFERLPVWLQLRCGMEPRTVAAVAGVLALATAFAVHHFWAGRPRTVQAPPVSRGAAMAPAARAAAPPASAGPVGGATAGPSPGGVVVDVTGKVRRPGVLRLPAGSRVTDALQAAGGALPGTDTGALNLARPLVDGEQVVVGRPLSPAGGPPGDPGTAGTQGTALGGAPGGTGAAVPVSLSTATVDQLDALPGVGPVLARHIVEYRIRHGGFTSVSQLRQVTGVGDRRFKDLQPLVRP